MKFRIEIETAGGTRVVTAGPADVIALERRRDAGLSTIGNDMRLEDLAFLAWHSLRRSDGGQVESDFDTWVESLDGINDAKDPVGEGEPPPAS